MRTWRLLLVGLLLLGSTAAAAAEEAPVADLPPDHSVVQEVPFEDLPSDHWAAVAVLDLLEVGVVSQSPERLFRPHEPVTRAELFKLVLTSRGVTIGSACQGLFYDVPCHEWFAPTAEMAYRLALTEGRGPQFFAPHEPVTREELFTVVNRAMGRHLEAIRLNWRTRTERINWFTDGDQISEWALGPVALMVADGYIMGFGDGSFRPAALATRAEAAVLVHRLLLRPEGETIEINGETVRYSQQMEMVASMYATGEPGVGTRTASGLTVREGIVATDPDVIPLGTLLYVEGYGYAVASDTGGGIRGAMIDLFTHSYDEAIQFGRRTRQVYVLP